MTEWFFCPTCEREFGDPVTEEHDGMLYGKCGRCGTEVSRPVDPEVMRR